MENKQYIVSYKSETPLVNYFLENFDYKIYEEPSFTQRLGLKRKNHPDIFFHSGTVKHADLELMAKSEKIVVNSNSIKQEIIKRSEGQVKLEQIIVIFPGHNIDKFKKKDYKKGFRARYNLEKDMSIVYFTGKNFEKTGLVYFLEFIGNLSSKKFKAAISGTPEQLKIVVELLRELNIADKVIVAQEDLFRVADIFILPTSNKLFASNVIKAMACKNVVFTPASNHAFELLDNFSIMSSPDEPATVHKVNMLLENTQEMKKIQKENYKKAKEYHNEKQFEKLKLALDI